MEHNEQQGSGRQVSAAAHATAVLRYFSENASDECVLRIVRHWLQH